MSAGPAPPRSVILLLPPSGSISSAIPGLIGADNRSRRLVEEFECGHGFYRKIERLVWGLPCPMGLRLTSFSPRRSTRGVKSLICPNATSGIFSRETGHRNARDEGDLPDGESHPQSCCA